MPEKSSNKASIVVALVTFLFILGGVYLLNRSMNSSSTNDSNSSNNSTEKSNSNPVSSNTSPVTPKSTATTDNLTAPTDELTSKTNTPATTESSKNTTNPPADLSKTPTTEPVTAPKPAISASGLTQSQLTAVYNGTTNAKSSWKITDCGIPNAKFCKAGASMSLVGAEAYTTLTVGKEYLFNADMSESDKEFLIEIKKIQLKP